MTDAYQLLFEACPHPYLVLRSDSAFTIEAVNSRYLSATGTERQAIVGKGLFEVFPDNPIDPTATGVSDLRISLERVLGERVQDVMGVQKYDIPRQDGDGFEVRYWSPVNSPVFGEDGRVAFIIHHVEDVTEFILSQQRSSAETAQRIESIQDRADRMRAEVLRRASEVKETNRQLKAAKDALERREAELARLNERLNDLDRAKTAFFSNVSHEFRTPLALMLGPIEDALDDAAELPALQRGRMELAHRNGLRLLKLVNTLLDFSRIEAGAVPAWFQPTHLALATAELASHFRSACEKAGLRLVVDCPPLDQVVFVDHDMWEKIVLNLLSNAFKFTFTGEIVVRLRAEHGQATLTVRDTGTGIPPHELPRLFERFHRIEGAQGRSMEGSGIGLALVHELVKLHGGTVQVDSAIGQGSSFEVTLPLGNAHLPAAHVRASPTLGSTALRADAFVEEARRGLPDSGEIAQRQSSEGLLARVDGLGRDGMRPRVLLADDNADMGDYVRRILADVACDVEAVRDGEEALAAAWTALPPDLVLTDVMMPRLDGLGLLRALRADPRTESVPVILLSARADEEARVEALSAGADTYMVKPFSGRELVARVEGCLRLARLRREKLAISEGIYRAIGESIDYGVWICAPDGRNTYASPSFLKMVGLTQQQCSDFGWGDVLHPDDVEHTVAAWRKCVATEGDWDIEHRFRGVDGKWHPVLARGVPVRDDAGKVAFWAGINLDIRRIKDAEAALRAAKGESEWALAEAERANLAKSKFLAAASHDLRQPVQALALLLAAIKPLATTERIAKAVGMMEAALDGLNGLLTSILDVSRIDAGVVVPKMHSVDVGWMLGRLCDEYVPECGKKALTLRCRCKPGLFTRTDGALLERILRNLIENAIRYTDRGGLLIGTRRRGDRLRIDLVDSGIGIPANKLEHVFEEFYQVANPARDQKQGLGLGLAIVSRLARLIGADVQVRSREGRGTWFTVTVPIDGSVRVVTGPSATAEVVTGRRIMVIEDNPKIRTGLELLLESWHCEVVGAESGEEALDLGERDGWRFDAIIADHRLGAGRSGTETAVEIGKRAGRPIPTLIVTGDTAPERICEVHASGFEMMHKPVTPDELARRMAGLLRGYSASSSSTKAGTSTEARP